MFHNMMKSIGLPSLDSVDDNDCIKLTNLYVNKYYNVYNSLKQSIIS